MLNLKQALREDIIAGIAAAQAAGELPVTDEPVEVIVNRADTAEHGDYASPVALALTKKVKKAPLDIVASIAKHMPKKEYIGKIEAAAPGFLNIRLNPGWLVARLDDLVEQDICQSPSGSGHSINLEFISANPTGPMTLGNARVAFSVDTLANVLACAGWNVTREYYINDAGAQIKKLGQSVVRRILQAQGESVEFPEDMYQGDYIKDVAQAIAETWRENEGKEFTKADLANDAVMERVSQQACEMLLADIKKTVQEDLRITFDVWTSERTLRASGIVEEVVAKLRQKKHTYIKDGAEYLRTTAFGDAEDRVLVKTDKEYAYIAPDIGYHQDKFNRQFDVIFTFVGPDHQGHAPKLRAAMEALGNDVAKLHIVASAWMRFVSNGETIKLSKRKGNIVTPKDLISEVGYDPARFFMVQHALASHMDFDLDLARERSDRNPVYYVQYAYVRLQSIVRRAKEEGVIEAIGEDVAMSSQSLLTHNAEIELLRRLYQLPEVVGDITRTFEVQSLAYYALDLAKAVHVFYKHAPVLGLDDKKLMASRLQLVVAARKVLGQTLDLLGLSKPDIM